MSHTIYIEREILDREKYCFMKEDNKNRKNHLQQNCTKKKKHETKIDV